MHKIQENVYYTCISSATIKRIGTFINRCLYLWQLDTEHPAVVFLSLDLALRNQLDKGFIRGVLLPPGLLQRYDIVMPQHRRDGHDTIALVYQNQVHQQTGRPPVAILERVNIHQAAVCAGRKLYWVKFSLLLCI